jgi:hypothetical protein
MSWDDLEEQFTPAEPDQRSKDINILITRTFAGDEGQKVLAWLRQIYLEQPSWQPGADSSFGHWREGQNSVIRDIEARIKKATNDR